jgi:multiple sugar transport system permease protein
MAITAFTAPDQTAAEALHPLSGDNILRLLGDAAVRDAMVNSFVIALLNATIAVALAIPSGYALARAANQNLGMTIALQVLWAALCTAFCIMLPLWRAAEALSYTTDSIAGLVTIYLAFNLPIAIWLAFLVFRNIPRRLEEAALVEGWPPSRVIRRITLPMALPGLAMTWVLCWIAAWNEYLFAHVFAGYTTQTITTAIADGAADAEVPPLALRLLLALIAAIPPTAAFMIFGRRLVQGLSFGAVRG